MMMSTSPHRRASYHGSSCAGGMSLISPIGTDGYGSDDEKKDHIHCRRASLSGPIARRRMSAGGEKGHFRRSSLSGGTNIDHGITLREDLFPD